MRTKIQIELETLARAMSKRFLHKFWGKEYIGLIKRVKGYCSHCGIQILLVKGKGAEHSLFLGTRHFRVGNERFASSGTYPSLIVSKMLIMPSDPISRELLLEHGCKKFVALL
jgi:hypothetical protein